jgi:hypothetical protein
MFDQLRRIAGTAFKASILTRALSRLVETQDDGIDAESSMRL